MKRLNPQHLLAITLLLLPLSLVIALTLGPEIINPITLLTGDAGQPANQLILEKIRLPRALMAAIIGATLAVAGVMMQGLFRNPLADPSLIGVTSGASAGASLMIVLGAGSAIGGVSFIALGAFAGAVIATTIVYKLASSSSGTSVATMLLAGIAISALAGAFNSFFQYIADNHMLRQISLWQMGSLNGSNWQRLAMAYGVLGLLLCWLPRYSRALNAMLLGESEARHLGIYVDRVKRQIIILVALAVGVAVALSGTIAFVGLITPHIIRLLIGPDHRYLIPGSALAGAILLVLADAVSRIAIAPSELPIGVVTAILGAPFFLSLLRQQRNTSLIAR
ncbi:iron ABC transporter permease [Dasania sp. GY-MA-18]|uniref:Iron ABC transporter permease n=1 Tax=Dasania phycosphaerae TaxID=2950436 RepID=A0A9J6RKB8_9GAMM|nr:MULTISPECIES: iron ABC transporter permease [Dasania]MCR8922503.1 iron ABC transporter permease [Dasania sp. GY-MA-18]MCZ0864931.1 iron ABC transporter permease [Dasania phycosphaerae]MCZ0868659.1 iron ABC transporter permease [Dasania phycosphaerae]